MIITSCLVFGIVQRMLDVVTVVHNQRNTSQSLTLEESLSEYADVFYQFWRVDNRTTNRGYAAAANIGASLGSLPVILFLNPDLVINGSFMWKIMEEFKDENLVITGERFGKPREELKIWGCRDWVCGACFAVRRSWWESVGGFDPEYRFGWEETSLIRLAQAQRRGVKSISLDVVHESPSNDTPEDIEYKELYFERGARRFRKQWARK